MSASISLSSLLLALSLLMLFDNTTPLLRVILAVVVVAVSEAADEAAEALILCICFCVVVCGVCCCVCEECACSIFQVRIILQ